MIDLIVSAKITAIRAFPAAAALQGRQELPCGAVIDRSPQLICKIPNTNMDACTGVEKEVDKVLSKFGGINDHADRTLGDLCTHIESLKNSIEEGG